MNLSQHKLIDNLINQGDIQKWIAVGDRNQSIYGFSGAYSSSFDLFLDNGNVKELSDNTVLMNQDSLKEWIDNNMEGEN